MTNFTLHRSAGLFAAVLMLVGALVTTSAAAAEKVLRIANLGEPETLDPHKTSTTVEFNVLCNLFEGLVVQDPKGNVAPGVAQTWSTSADGHRGARDRAGGAGWAGAGAPRGIGASTNPANPPNTPAEWPRRPGLKPASKSAPRTSSPRSSNWPKAAGHSI